MDTNETHRRIIAPLVRLLDLSTERKEAVAVYSKQKDILVAIKDLTNTGIHTRRYFDTAKDDPVVFNRGSVVVEHPDPRHTQVELAKVVDIGRHCTVAVLLQLDWLGTIKRREWWNTHAPSHLLVLAPRPRLTYTSKEVGWFVWDNDSRMVVPPGIRVVKTIG